MQQLRQNWHWAALGLLILFFGLKRYSMRSMFLERDEGEYAYMGWRILEGELPFSETGNMKLPGTSFMYAAGMYVFGENKEGIHILLLCINLITLFLVFRVSLDFFGKEGAVLSALLFGTASLLPQFYGFAAHATHFVSLFAMGAFRLLQKHAVAQKSGLVFLAGLLSGLAILMKQSGAGFALSGFAILLMYSNAGKRIRHALLFSGATLLPYLLLCLLFLAKGSFENFWFWTVEYAREYAQPYPLILAPRQLLASLIDVSPQNGILFTVLILSILSLISGIINKDKKVIRTALWFAGGFLGMIPGLVFRAHYYLLLFPTLAIAFASLLSPLKEAFEHFQTGASRFTFPVLLLSGFGVWIQNREIFLQPVDLKRDYYSGNYFEHSQGVADWIKENSKPGEKIAILGSEPQVLFLAKRVSVTPYLYVYPLFEKQKFGSRMREDFFRELKRNQPPLVIYFGNDLSWFNGNLEGLDFLDTLDDWLAEHYMVAQEWKTGEPDFDHNQTAIFPAPYILFLKRK